jgi:hypothetical protein
LLRPIIDFSVPPGEVYEVVPAWQLFERKLELSPRQVVLINTPDSLGAYDAQGT